MTRLHHPGIVGIVTAGTASYAIRRADPADLDAVVAVLDEAGAWLAAKNVDQWPERFPPEQIRRSIGRGETWVALDGGRVAATIALDRTSVLWPGEQPPAVYVHRLALSRKYAGLGHAMLAWVDRYALAVGAVAVRLECVARNPRLRQVYRDHGFTERGEAGYPKPGIPGGLGGLMRFERPVPTEVRDLAG